MDISQAEESQGMYEHENQVLKSIVEALPNLTSLDISGTNLAGKGEEKLFIKRFKINFEPEQIPENQKNTSQSSVMKY